MAHPHQEILQAISDYLQSGLEMVKELGPDLAAVRVKLTGTLTTNQNFVHGLMGQSRAAMDAGIAPTNDIHKPPTHQFGVKLIYPDANKPLRPGVSNPDSMEKTKFLAEVNDWYANFTSLQDEKIFNKSTIPGGLLVLQGVAKKAGFENFEETEIGLQWIAGVKKAIEAKEMAQRLLDDAELTLKKKTK